MRDMQETENRKRETGSLVKGVANEVKMVQLGVRN